MWYRFRINSDNGAEEYTNSKRRAIAKARDLAAYNANVYIIDRNTLRRVEF